MYKRQVSTPLSGKSDRPTVALLGEMFPADPIGIGGILSHLGLAAGPVVPCREWRELYGALDCSLVSAIHPFYTASIREFEEAGRPILGSAPVGSVKELRIGFYQWVKFLILLLVIL